MQQSKLSIKPAKSAESTLASVRAQYLSALLFAPGTRSVAYEACPASDLVWGGFTE